MSKSNRFRVFDVNGALMQFDYRKFNIYFTEYCKPDGKSKIINYGDAEQQLGDCVHVTKAAVHQWRFGNNGPDSIDIIKEIATFLGLDSYTSLLSEKKEHIKMNYSAEQLNSFKRI